MDIPPYEKEEKKALPDLRALAGMSPEMKRRDRKRLVGCGVGVSLVWAVSEKSLIPILFYIIDEYLYT